jgi:hypothetical protein
VEVVVGESRVTIAMGRVNPSLSTASPGRRLHLIDAMVLVLATAGALAADRWLEATTNGAISWSNLAEICDSYRQQPEITIDNHADLADVVFGLSFELAILTLPLFAAWTVALIPLHLRAPRKRMRRLANQPGVVAVCAASLSFVVGALYACALWVVNRPGPCTAALAGDEWRLSLALAPSYPGLAVVASWATLVLGARWRADRGWLDRLGRALGVYWIAIAILSGLVLRVQ